LSHQLTYAAQAIKVEAPEDLAPERLEELLRDPPPPANFPIYCRSNPHLRHLLKKIDLGVFQRNGLHNIPYRDDRKKNLPPLTFDGKQWPKGAAVKEIPLVESDTGDIVDVWALQERQAALEEKEYIRYFDIKKNTLGLMIRSIKWPEEMRLLPHVIREWHRRGLPVTEVDATRIARRATEFDEMEVVFQMMQPAVYGLYYDIYSIREITRGMARRASRSPAQEGEKEGLTPEEMLNRIPEVLNCSFAKDSRKVLLDPAIVGTQLWAFVWRFNNDERYRTSDFLEATFMLADRFIKLTLESEIIATETPVPVGEKERKDHIHAVKRQLLDYTPSINAVRQLLAIIASPYQTILFNNTPSNTPPAQLKRVKRDVEQLNLVKAEFDEIFVKGDVRADSKHLSPIPKMEQVRQSRTLAGTPSMRWVQFNKAIVDVLSTGQVHASGLNKWQQALLQGYTTPAGNPDLKMYYLPLRLWHVLHVLEGKALLWRSLLKMNNIQVRSEFAPKIVEHVSQKEVVKDTEEEIQGSAAADAGSQEEAAETTGEEQEAAGDAEEDDDGFVVEEYNLDEAEDDDFKIEEVEQKKQ
jgi:hypothetical protein